MSLHASEWQDTLADQGEEVSGTIVKDTLKEVCCRNYWTFAYWLDTKMNAVLSHIVNYFRQY